MYETEGPSCTSELSRWVAPSQRSDVLHRVPARPDWLSVSRLPLVELPPGRAVRSVRAPEFTSNATVLGFPFPFAGVAPWTVNPFAPTGSSVALFDVDSVARSVIS